MSSRTKQHVNIQSQKLLVVKANIMQTNLFDLLNKKGKYEYKGTCIHYSWNKINLYVECGTYNDLDKWAKWYWRRKRLIWASINYTTWIKTYEMLSANKSKAKKTNME